MQYIKARNKGNRRSTTIEIREGSTIMAESIISGVIVKLLEYMGRSAVEVVAPYLGGRRQLKELHSTMKLIQARLLDAERRGEGENEALVKEWLNRLKDLIYRLEDLFEVVAMADDVDERIPEGKLTKCLCVLCSSRSPVKINKKVAREAKLIMRELNAIRSDMFSLNLGVLSIEDRRLLSLMNGRETQSFILEKEVIGRDDDKKVIVQMLLDAELAEVSVSIIPIVGIGGLGKTTLAQLAYNDDNVQPHFELRGWACIAGITSVEELARNILKAFTDDDYQRFNMGQLQLYLREVVDDKRYLLVLDDMWDEDRERWLLLKRLLFGGKRGSKIIVTSRSGVVAQNMCTVSPYQLGGLREDESWALFKSLAFKEGQQEKNPNLTSIGKEIVKKCANVPLAIRTIAGILYSKDTEQEWEYFKDSELRLIEPNDNSIMATLKLSYDHLPSHLKQCFAYCSLFPKDYELDKQSLIYLWIAQGFIRSSNGNESLEDIGHAYFMELLRRSFFQDVTRNEYDDIVSCKMHSLMNDLARIVALDDCILVESPKQHINDCICHLSLIGGSSSEAPSGLLAAKKMRSLILLSDSVIQNIDKIFSSMRCLRSLDLSNANCKSLPNSIEELKHLRYVRLGSHLESLPYAITKLRNLCTLDIRRCYKLKELPRGFNNLTKLRNLHNGERLIDMPPGFGKLTSLRALDIFIVGESNGVDALARLDNLAGELKIRYLKHRQRAITEARVANLKDKKIKNLFLTWSSAEVDQFICPDEEEEVLKWLQPPPSVKRLKILGWKGVQFPQWGMEEFRFLVSISIRSCHRCRRLPSFSKLPHLRFLRLWDLGALEYIESGGGRDDGTSSATAYYPSLESLLLSNLPELKRWSSIEDIECQRNGNHHHQYSLSQRRFFPCLSELGIEDCPKLMSIPGVPRLESLDANLVHGKLLKDLLSAEESATPYTLKWLHIHAAEELVSLSISLFTVKSLTVSECQELIHLTAESPTVLQRLVIDECCRLTDISSALQHLSDLEELEIRRCEELDLGYTNIRTTVWHGLKSLRSLELQGIPKLEVLPEGVGSLTTLQRLKLVGLSSLRTLSDWIENLTQLHVLEIRECPKLVALPQSFRNLSSLQELRISICPDLQTRCKCPDGEDWSVIQHIPDICVG